MKRVKELLEGGGGVGEPWGSEGEEDNDELALEKSAAIATIATRTSLAALRIQITR
jgi:hypothetical protein